jgi:beta-glucanase (GH16 family)
VTRVRAHRAATRAKQRAFWALVIASGAILLLVVGFVVAAPGGHGSAETAAKHHHATTPPTTTSSSGADPSGQAMPVGDIPGWHQVFADSFTTNVPLGSFPTAVSSKWGAYPDGWHDTSGHGTYMPSKVVSVQNGVMNLHVHTENGVHMVAVPYPVIPGASSHNGQLYGRYAVRFRADPLAGYKTAFLLWPDSGVWPRDGEIDFPEGDLNRTISAFVHRRGGTRGGDRDHYSTSSTYPSWHTAVIEWGPSATKFILDGATIGTSVRRIPNTPMHWVLQTETALDRKVPSDSTAGDVQIDWVAVYRPA